MNLMPDDLAARFAAFPLYSQDGKGFDAVVVAKYFLGSFTYLATEASKEGDGWTLFGYCTINGSDWEWGYQNLAELEAIRATPLGLEIERDLYLDENTTVREALADLGVEP